MKRKVPKKPRIRAPLPKPTRFHSTKKGLKGYDRTREKHKPQQEAFNEIVNNQKKGARGNKCRGEVAKGLGTEKNYFILPLTLRPYYDPMTHDPSTLFSKYYPPSTLSLSLIRYHPSGSRKNS